VAKYLFNDADKKFIDSCMARGDTSLDIYMGLLHRGVGCDLDDVDAFMFQRLRRKEVR